MAQCVGLQVGNLQCDRVKTRSEFIIHLVYNVSPSVIRQVTVYQRLLFVNQQRRNPGLPEMWRMWSEGVDYDLYHRMVHDKQTMTFMYILLYVAFCTLRHYGDRRKPEARTMPYFYFEWLQSFFYSAQYHRQHCTLHAFEQFRALYMNNHDGKYPARSGLEPGTSRLQTPVDTNEPSGPAQTMAYIQW